MFGGRRTAAKSRNARLAIEVHAHIDRVTSGLFVAAVAAPIVFQLARREHPSVLADEYRTAAPAPRVPASAREVIAFPERFQSFYDDNFGMRDVLLAAHEFVKLSIFGVSPAKDVIVGRDGWLFLNRDHACETSLGYVSLPRDHFERWVSELAARQRWFREHDITYAFAFAPNKEEIYLEHVPERLARAGPSPLDVLDDCAARRGVSCFVDLRPALLAAKARDVAGDPLYHPGDTHWTPRGAWVASNALLAHLHTEIATLEPSARASVEETRVECMRGDLDREVGRENSLATTPMPVPLRPRALETFSRMYSSRERRFVVDDASLPRVLLLHDSFGTAIAPFLAEHCSELVCWPGYAPDEDAIESMRPDVVIQLYTQRIASSVPVPMHSELRPLTSDECAAIEPSVDIDRPDVARKRLVLRGATTMASTETGEPDGVVIEMKDAADSFAVPAVAFAPGAHPIVHVDITAPQATALHVYYMTRAEPSYARTRTCRIALRHGRNDVCFEIRAEGVDGVLLVRPGLEPGRYVLHRIAIGSSSR